MTRRFGVRCTVLMWLFAQLAPAAASDTNTLLRAWLAAQPSVLTWQAGFVQTRALKSLVHPLVTHGRVWFQAPDRFRWELGQPPQTIAVRQTNQVLILYPKLQRVEVFPLDADQTGPWRDALALLEAGFPRSLEALESRFRLLAMDCTNQLCEVTLQPRSTAARRLMPQIRIGFGTDDFGLRSTELRFADGSSMRNDFTNMVANPPLDENLFRPVIEPNWKVTEPARPVR